MEQNGKATIIAILSFFITFIDSLESRSEEENITILKGLADRIGVKLGDFMMPVRMAITGKTVSPPLLESILILGINESKSRLRAARKLLEEA